MSMRDVAAAGALPWAVGVALGLPLLLILLGELSGRLERDGHPLAGPLRRARTWVLPALALVLILRQVALLPASNVWLRLALTALGILVAATLLSVLNVVLFEQAAEGSWQRRVPRLLRDLVRLLLVAIAAAIVYSTVWGKDLSGGLAALGVTSIVVGLALQEPLGNLFSGVMLLMERPFEVGDDIEVGAVSGVVKDINWRSAHVQSFGGIVRVIPNSMLNKESITNYSRPRRLRMEIVEIGFSYDDPPSRVREILLQAALDTPMILHDPQPFAVTWAYGDFAITYRIVYRTAEDDRWAARNELMTRLWYVTKRHGLTIPYPVSVNLAHHTREPYGPSEQTPREQLARFERIPPLAEQEPPGSVQAIPFAAGERLFDVGDKLDGVYFVTAGTVSLQVGEHQAPVEVAVLQPGEFLGETGLYGGQASEYRAVALCDTRVLLIAPDTLQRLFVASPHLARETGATMNVRRRAAHAARQAEAAGERTRLGT